MPKLLKKGYKWDSLEVLWMNYIDQSEDQGGGITVTRKVKCYGFRCACGKEFQVPVSEFIGERKVHDCGCGDAVGGGSGSLTVSLPLKVKAMILDFAMENGYGKSEAFYEALKPWLRAYRASLAEREKKQAEANEQSERSMGNGTTGVRVKTNESW